MKAVSLAIVGTQFPNKRGPTRRFELQLCRPGEPIELRPEPKNPADENAIAIYSCRGVQLGYVASVRAVHIIGYIRSGREVRAVYQGVGPTGAWVRVTFDGSEPVIDLNRPEQPLPSPLATRDAPEDVGFWPDPIYDDD